MIRLRFHFFTLCVLILLAPGLFAQTNGKMQIHFMDVGQGDGAVLVTPNGKVILFDAGIDKDVDSCDKPKSYLDQLGITQIDAIVVSHYHSDHIGCIPEILEGRTLAGPVYDRGKSYDTATFRRYLAAVKTQRQTVALGTPIKFDEDATPVIVSVIAVNGAGVPTTNENDLSVSVRIAFGAFRAEIGGDLSGEDTGDYQDIETVVAADAGPLDVYKVHHHCSKYSTNDAWLQVTRPTIGIVSTGNLNGYGHPAQSCLDRLHHYGTKTYWTERGNGGTPTAGQDTIAKNIIVEVTPGSANFTARYGTTTEPYALKDTSTVVPAGPQPNSFAWSKRSGAKVYHFSSCDWVKNINPENLERGTTPPAGKTLHPDCPTHHP